MNNLVINIFWTLNNYCKSECTYCPSRFRNGEEPKHISEYIRIAKSLIENYSIQHRTINWTFNGGELLDMFDFPEFLKLCKTSNGTIELTTNGGRLWLDWWAIEPYVDILHLSYHYWQNPNLIKFIIQAFIKNNKKIDINVPIRPGVNFDSDWNRAMLIQDEFNIQVNKNALYKDASSNLGYLDYTEKQFELLLGKEWVENNLREKPKTFQEIVVEVRNKSPSFTGKLCNVGIENLHIGPEGWASGSSCNNTPLGNIWKDNFYMPSGPSICKMIVCTNSTDQQITKFD